MPIFATETYERLCNFPCEKACFPAFSPCGEWVSCVNKETQCAEIRDVKTGALKHSFGDEGDETFALAWSPCGTKLLSCRSKGLQVWHIATGVVVHEWDHIVECLYVMVVTGDRVAMFGDKSKSITFWDYTTGVEVLVLTCPSDVHYVALSPNERFIAASCNQCVCVWDIETGESVFEEVSENVWLPVAVSNDIVAVYPSEVLCVRSISTGEQLLRREFENNHSCGLALSSCGGAMMYGSNVGIQIVDISHVS